jgi:hypothetical protein
MQDTHSGRAVAVTLAAGLAVLILAVVLALSDRDLHLAGTNNVFSRFPVAEIRPGDELCEQLETVPADAAAVRLSVAPGSPSAPGPLAVRVVREGRNVSRGARPGSWEADSVEVPIVPVARTLTEAEVCVANRGDAALTLLGYGVEPARLGFKLRGEQVDQQIRLEYLRAEPESWWAMAGVVAHRLGLGRGELFGGWIALAWLIGVLAMGAVAARLLLRKAWA